MKIKVVYFYILLLGLVGCSKDNSVSLPNVKINTFSPTSGVTGAVVTLDIDGQLPDTDNLAVFLGNNQLDILSVTPTSIRVKIKPTNDVVDHPFRVLFSEMEITSAETFNHVRPKIDDFFPKTGAGDTEITLTGRNFEASIGQQPWISLGEKKAEIISINDSLIKVKSPYQEGFNRKVALSYHLLEYTYQHPTRYLSTSTFAVVNTKDLVVGSNLIIKDFSKRSETTFRIGGLPATIRSSVMKDDGFKEHMVEIPEGLRAGRHKIIASNQSISYFSRNNGQVLVNKGKFSFSPSSGIVGSSIEFRTARTWHLGLQQVFFVHKKTNIRTRAKIFTHSNLNKYKGKFSIKVPKRLTAGEYEVQVYSPNKKNQLIAELPVFTVVE